MEEPTERQNCEKIALQGCMGILEKLLDDYRTSIYAYNSMIKKTGFYLKPVHKVYYKNSHGTKIIYEYHGMYWWKKQKKGYKVYLKYYGKQKPEGLPDPPVNPLSGVIIDKTEGLIIVPKSLFGNMKTETSRCKIRCIS
ncbi:MAG: hypothetical protein F7B60_07080 [Desulfurococcales archaeon]|nr:hypothetical protein [Desulfurococcales archaeon]